MTLETLSKIAKSVLFKIPGLRRLLREIKLYIQNSLFLIRVKNYKKDFSEDSKFIGWKRLKPDYWKLSSELIFYYHKLEKGLCLPPENQRWFGSHPAEKTISLMREWENSAFSKDAPIYQASCAVLKAYYEFSKKFVPENTEATVIVNELKDFLESQTYAANFSTPIALPLVTNQESYKFLHELTLSRRSVRDFIEKPVELDLVRKATEIAQLSPSACNRQPWKLHVYEKRKDIDELLALQNGNRGFGHKIPMLAVVSCDLGSFFDSTERFEPHLDGGLFLMSFILALQSLGIASCCLNWCVSPDKDVKAHDLGKIPPNHRILTFLAVGYPEQNVVVPLSARRPISDVLISH